MMIWLCIRLYILLGYIIYFSERKEKDMKAESFALFYVQLILDGKYAFADVPKRLKKYVKQVAIDLGVWEDIEGSTQEHPATPSNAD